MDAAAGAGPEGFEEYVRCRYGDLRRLAFLLSGDWATADDLVQTALIRCERRWPVVEPASRHAYVRQAVVNLSATWRVRRRVHRPLSDLDATATQPAASDVRVSVLAALAAVPLPQRQVLVLRYYEGLSEAEIASTLGISAGTVKSRAARALVALRQSGLRDLVEETR